MKKFFNKKTIFGFTLIELLIVITIVSILAIVVFFNLDPLERLQQTRNASREKDVEAIANAIKLYQVDNNGQSPIGLDGNLRVLGTAINSCDVACSGYNTDASWDDLIALYHFDNNEGKALSVGDLDGVTDANLKGLWHFNETLGALNDSSGNSNTGTGSNIAYDTYGKFSNSLSFNGSSSYLSINDSSSLSFTDSLSWELWFITGYDGQQALMRKNSVGSPNYLLDISINAINQLQCTYYDGSSYFIANSTSYINDNIWHHAVMTINGATLSCYLDGSLKDTATITGTQGDPDNALWIGAYQNGSGYFLGNIDEVVVYNTPLSVSQIQNHYNRGVATDFINNYDGRILGAYSDDSQSDLNKSLNFDGVDDGISLGSAIFSTSNGLAPYSVEAWIKTADDDGAIIAQYSGATNSFGLRLQGGVLKYWKGSDVTSSAVSGLNNDQWHHIAFTKNSFGDVQLYVDGQASGSVASDISAFVNIFTLIGAVSSTAVLFDGLIDEVSIYNTALSATDISRHYSNLLWSQSAQSSCLDLSNQLSNYLSSIPFDPLDGSASNTLYAIKKPSNSALTVVACNAELSESISVSR